MSVIIEIPLGNETYKKIELDIVCKKCSRLLEWDEAEVSTCRRDLTLEIKHTCKEKT